MPLKRWHPVTVLALIASRWMNYKILAGAGEPCSHLIVYYQHRWEQL